MYIYHDYIYTHTRTHTQQHDINTHTIAQRNTTITQCVAADGGGMHSDNGTLNMSHGLEIRGCEATSGKGGALYQTQGSHVYIDGTACVCTCSV
jgi:hypothetical protein